ncbi:MAG: hypothetical protein HGGPFJEG_00851 [Ignavibacteria bacterium]|nr:hypothetical protein [Ignavibacteria bacterium]
MAKDSIKYNITFKSLKEKLSKGDIPGNMLISAGSKIVFDEIIEIVCKKFTGKSSCEKDILISFNSEDKPIENVINECSSTGLFADKKIVILKNIKKLPKADKMSLVEYLKRPNSDACLIMESSGEELNPAKLFFYDKKDGEENTAEIKKTIEHNVSIFQISSMNETEIIDWLMDKFEDYKISMDTLKHFIQFSNYSPDELISEAEKLKTYCYGSKEITKDAVNLCNGMEKDFNENDFIKALIEKDTGKAFRIYESISLKKDAEVFIIFLLNSSFTAIYKMYDPAVNGMNEWDLKRSLKLWFPDQDKLIPLYKKFRSSAGREKIAELINQIYKTDKMLKTSSADKRNIMSDLIHRICSS